MKFSKTKFYDNETVLSYCYASPNVEGTSNPTATGGSQMGVVVGKTTTETLGFYGATGVAQPTGTSSFTTVAQVVAQLQALGLFGA